MLYFFLIKSDQEKIQIPHLFTLDRQESALKTDSASIKKGIDRQDTYEITVSDCFQNFTDILILFFQTSGKMQRPISLRNWPHRVTPFTVGTDLSQPVSTPSHQ